MKTPRLILGSALLIFLAAPVQAMEHEEGSLNWPEEGTYFSCLDDTLYGTVYYTLLSHEVNTPSGVAHTIGSFYGTGYIYSPETLRVWTERFSIPIVGTVTLHQGETFMLQEHDVFIPDDPHDPLFFYEQVYKFTVNANGELVVEMLYPDADAIWPDDFARCVGTGQESKRNK